FRWARATLSARTLDHAGPGLHRRRLAAVRCRCRQRGADARALPWAGGFVIQPLRAGLRALGARERLALCRGALSRLLGRALPGAARLPLGRPRRDRLDAVADPRAA